MSRIIIDARKSGSPFFSALAKGNTIIASSKSNGLINPLEHAEMLTMGKALKKLGSDNLRGLTLYSTCESCPMCMGAIYWTGIREAVFGARLTDSKRFGFKEIIVPRLAEMLKTSGVKIKKDIMRKECLELFNQNYSLTKLCGLVKTKKVVDWSTNIDKTLYG